MRMLAYPRLVADQRDLDKEPISAEGLLVKTLGGTVITLLILGLMML